VGPAGPFWLRLWFSCSLAETRYNVSPKPVVSETSTESLPHKEATAERDILPLYPAYTTLSRREELLCFDAVGLTSPISSLTARLVMDDAPSTHKPLNLLPCRPSDAEALEYLIGTSISVSRRPLDDLLHSCLYRTADGCLKRSPCASDKDVSHVSELKLSTGHSFCEHGDLHVLCAILSQLLSPTYSRH